MEIIHEISGSGGRFLARREGRNAGFVIYARTRDKIIIQNTYVSGEFRGLSVAQELIGAAAEYAKHRERRMSSACWYTRLLLKNNQQWSVLFDDLTSI